MKIHEEQHGKRLVLTWEGPPLNILDLAALRDLGKALDRAADLAKAGEINLVALDGSRYEVDSKLLQPA